MGWPSFSEAPSVPKRPGEQRGPAGRLLRALDGTGWLDAVHPGWPECRTAALGLDVRPYRVRHVCLGYGGGRPGIVSDRRRGWGTVENVGCGGNDLRRGFYVVERNCLSGAEDRD